VVVAVPTLHEKVFKQDPKAGVNRRCEKERRLVFWSVRSMCTGIPPSSLRRCLTGLSLLAIISVISRRVYDGPSLKLGHTCEDTLLRSRSFEKTLFFRPQLTNGAYGAVHNAFTFTAASVCDEEVCVADWPGDNKFEQEFRNVIPAVPASLHKKCHSCCSCAIVGPSARLLKQNFGQQIDSYTHVIRLNKSPTTGYERHTGTRTSFRVCSVGCTPDMFRWAENHGVTFLFYILRASRDLHWMRTAKARGVQFAVLTPSWFAATRELFKLSKRPTTGSVAVLWALNSGMCHSVDLYGFSAAFNNAHRSKFDYHYYEHFSKAEGLNELSDFHEPIEVEGTVYNNLANNGVIRIF
jgi:hypothetical protein